MEYARVIQLLQIEKEYTLKQTGHQQQPINKEVRQALDIAIEAVKKQGPKKPKAEPYFYGINYRCANCDKHIALPIAYPKPPYCPHCGQAVDWEEENESGAE